MTPDEFDTLLRSSLPAVDPLPERVDRVIAQVMNRLEERPRPWSWNDLAGWLLLPLPRYAVPMAIAALLGTLYGANLVASGDAADQPPLLSLIAPTTSTHPLGF